MSRLHVDFPYRFDHRGRTATTDYDDYVRDLIEQLLLTNPGERVNRPDFGSGLLQLVFEPNSPELAAALQVTARAALDRWLRDVVQVEELTATSEDSTLHISLRYIVLQTGRVVETSMKTSVP